MSCTTTRRGFAPSSTPHIAESGLVIAIGDVPTVMTPSLIVACMLTVGELCLMSGLVRLNVTEQATPASNPADAAVSTSCPVLCVQLPTVPSELAVEETANI